MARGGKRGRVRIAPHNNDYEVELPVVESTYSQVSSTPDKAQTNDTNGTVDAQSDIAKESNQQVTPQSSYASLVDPEEGSELKFIPTYVVNGVQCAKREKKDVAAEIDYWQQAILCLVLGANPPFEVIQGFIKRIWAKLAIDKTILVRKGAFLVRFGNIGEKGVYYFDSKPFIVKGWNPEMDMQTESIISLPLWVQLPALDGADSLSKIGSALGIPLKTNCFAKDRTMLRYAKLLIDVSLDSPFPEFIEFFNDNDVLVSVLIAKCLVMKNRVLGKKGELDRNGEEFKQSLPNRTL
ncbi:LOW QUALITY PROTEIN: hypothetical protein Cgig2_026633 [Carnegiea gigantea]|uniref:DUF4283 domain-containing protein n=1 Tax=Carnegiea gigantea TaxID=171969 RepID=A0A9Q1JLS5_9CARY|nr:LOW QUALITY PROTEIN: hypothetical protein Cgig2_026633 [Carnegiea gigantea]